MRKILITSMTAIGLAAVPAMAQDVTGTIGGGASASDRDGSAAGGMSAGARIDNPSDRDDKHDRKHDRRDRKHDDRNDAQAPDVNSATTYGAGTVYTDRNRATGGVTAGGTATGTGDQNAESMVNAYGQTDDSGSTAEVYGDAAAGSTSTDDSED